MYKVLLAAFILVSSVSVFAGLPLSDPNMAQSSPSASSGPVPGLSAIVSAMGQVAAASQATLGPVSFGGTMLNDQTALLDPAGQHHEGDDISR